MSKLEILIAELCPDGVEIRCLEDCCNLLDKKRKPVTKAFREHLTRLTDIRGSRFGQGADCMSIFRYLLFPMAQIRSIIPTVPDGMQKRNMRKRGQARRRRATALNLPASGRTLIIV